MSAERRNIKRRKCNYYLRVVDSSTQQLVGYFSDLSTQGFKVDSPQPLPVDKDFNLRVDLTSDISDRAYIAFIARSRWMKPDFTDPSLLNAGFQIIGISPHDNEIFQRVVQKYSTESAW